MKKRFVMGFVGLAMIASFAGCVAPDDGAQVGESTSELGLGSPGSDFTTLCTAGGVQMHCCPDGLVMTGIHVNDNMLVCARLESGFAGPVTLDAGTVRNNMHACPFGQLMVGIHVINNYLACRPSAQAISFEFTDVSTTDTFSGRTVHVCPNTTAMAGIHVINNWFTCDQ